MRLFRLSLKNIRGHGFRSIAIFLAVMGVAGFLLTTTLIIKGAEYSLDSGLKRLGADMLVVPTGAESKVESALLMGKPTNVWMSSDNLKQVASLQGVQSVSSQVYLSSLYGAACCAVSEMFMVVFDPQTDFTVTPWLNKTLGRGLKPGEVIGGNYVFVPENEKYIRLYGYNMTLVGNLAPTGTGIDQTLFMTMDTALAMAQSSKTTAVEPLIIPPNQISTILVKVAPGSVVHSVALRVIKQTSGMIPIESPDLFGAFRGQMNGLLWGFFSITIIIWAISMVLIGIIFSMAANERKREMAVLRAVGATRNFIFGSVLTEAGLLALCGAVCGILIGALGLWLFKDYLAETLKMPFLFPAISSFLSLFVIGVSAAIVTVILAAMIPAYRISRQELAIAMRE